MNVNLHLDGEIESFINRLVKRGLAANKTDAIRLAIVRYYEDHSKAGMLKDEPLDQSSIDASWNNANDERSSSFYKNRYLHGKKA